MPSLSRVNRSLLIGLSIVMCLGAAGPVLTPANATAQEQRPNCANFLNQEDAQVAFDADPSDPFNLDEAGEGDGVACQDPAEDFNSQSLTNCSDLRGDPRIAQALYDHSLTKYGSDRYDLAACVEQGASGTDQSTSNAGSWNTDASSVVVIARTGFSGETLEARLDAHFLALENRFADFEARAENGFGRFPESGDDTAGGGRAATASVSIARPVTKAQRTTSSDDRPVLRSQKAKDGDGERGKERKGKRDRNKGKQRNRR